ncbi:structural maintenance of chromosomes flexible hinge domain-containing protein 1-like isoform X2 [Simochromis diagramma]|uniref:structural maintenance of chromosomes flexible hinge domain-containing protein 1-like isoform X2 n=1 Tax=Simochromis diagramma TaxID=43689 RepID=UPI001A7E8A56|nr:structural maintenance of chromosomes flexible hinge domain-containing protein 1-like isoform X2 [Simochromis diagramma]
MLTSASQRRSAAASLQQGEKKIRVYDLRLETEAKTCKLFEIAGWDFNDFLQALHKEFGILACETFVVATTDRIFLNFHRFKELQDGATLYLLQDEHQVLPTATVEKISFMPHYNILIKSGIYEYYASENKESLAYPLAELIDNSLSATAKNTGTRIIEIRMQFDESLGKPAVIVLDNGRGMTTKQLNKWAVYRHSKFTKETGSFARREEDYVRPDPVPRSLNSDISYFGVGGKQAVFHFGNVVRMISKPVGLPDVHELVLSEEEFERKEKNKEDIYSTTILNRKPGDFSHVSEDERFLRTIIDEERGKESFTAVVITGLKEKHISFLKQNFDAWTRHLAHIYHYYIHGVNGNDLKQGSKKTAQQPTIDIQITLREKPNKCPRVLNLREVDDDMQTLYINSAADTFEFKASSGPGGGTVEGVLRYHPFLYDRETYPKYPEDPEDPKDPKDPKDTCSANASSENDNLENEPGLVTQEERKIFECFWNGRLIPGTKVAEFDWCSRKHNSRTAADIPPECYRRLSGVLFTDDNFQVTTNKMTFMDLELKLKNNQTIFSLVLNGQGQEVCRAGDQRGKQGSRDEERERAGDRGGAEESEGGDGGGAASEKGETGEGDRGGVVLGQEKGGDSGSDDQREGDKAQRKAAQEAQISRESYGEGNSRATGQKSSRGNIQKEFTQWLRNCNEKFDKQIKFMGFKEIKTRTDVSTKKMQHPWAVFSAIEWGGRTYKTGQLVKTHNTNPILYGKVVQFLLYGNFDGDVYATGGQVEVSREPKALWDMNKIVPISKIDKTATDEAIKKNIDSDSEKLPDKLNVEWPNGNPLQNNGVLSAGTTLGPLKIDILNKRGEKLSRMSSVGQGKGTKLCVKLTLLHHGQKSDKELAAYVAPHLGNNGFWFKKMENLTELGKYTLNLNTVVHETNAVSFGGRALPTFTLKFTIKEGDAASFDISAMSPTLRVGVPFDISLQIKDGYGHSTTLTSKLTPELKCCGLDLSYGTFSSSGTTFTIKNVKARGKVLNYQQSKSYDLEVTLPGLKQHTKSIKISLLPGIPNSLHVKPEETSIDVENGDQVTFHVEVHDEAGNITANPKQIVRCEVKGFPPVVTDCSSTGAGQLVTKPINLKIMKGEQQELKAQFVMPSYKNIPLVMKELRVLPSTRVSVMELYSQDNENLVLRNSEKIEWIAGGLLENLFYKLYDEAGREVPLTAEIASMIKVNWTGDVFLEDLVQGKLPDLQVPKRVGEQRFYQVSYQDQSVSVSFTIVPRPDEPERLKVALPQTTVKLGEILSGNISLELVDQYDNLTKTLTPTCLNHIKVEAEGLDKSAITFKWQDSSCAAMVTGIRFQSGSLGPRELSFSYSDFVERVSIKVTAGLPAQLKLISEPEQPLQVLNDHGISKPFVVQLCDEWGNPSPDQRVVVDLKTSPPGLTVKTNVISQPVNAEGKAFFIVNGLSGPKGHYQLQFKGSFNKKPIPGPSVSLTVLPDPKKPVSLSVEYDTSVKFFAGSKFPVFSVTVVSDEGSPITTFNPAAVSMFIWDGVSSGKKPPERAIELKCNKPMKNEKNDCFHFRDKDIPEEARRHTIQFSLRIDKKDVLYSNQIRIDVVANQPVKLGPVSQTPTPVVSYSEDIASRTLVENMTLRIMDLYGNPAGQDLGGKVIITIKSSDGERNKSFPLFERGASSLAINLVEGKAHIPRLAIRENSPGDNSSTYILVFKPEVSVHLITLTAFELPFLFYNDAQNQQKMSELTRKKDELSSAIDKYNETLRTYKELLDLLTESCLIASKKETDLKNELRQKKVTIPHPISAQHIDTLIKKKTTEAEAIQKVSRRVFSVRDNFRGQADVLGMVGHLALVQDDAAAWVISWHIRGDMDCVITKTTEAAQQIYRDTQGRQQVMALDSVLVPPGKRPLPHIRNGYPLFEPHGNPVYARELLIYPCDPESCDIVFKNILGDTILIDDLDSANNYRRAVVQNRIQCPTILTRQGDRVSSRGKFGGAQNRAPPMTTLHMFGAPLPQQYHSLKEQIDLLSQYCSVVSKREETERARDDHVKKITSPDVRQKEKDLDDKKRQLTEIEKELASASAKGMKRRAVDGGQPSSSISKRARQSST